MFFPSFDATSYLAMLCGCLASIDWTRAVDRIVDEMSPAYLFVVILIGTAVRLAYKYFERKIDSMADKDEAFLALIQDSLSTISQLEGMFKSINKKLDRLFREQDNNVECKRLNPKDDDDDPSSARKK